MNYMKQVADMLGVKLYEEFRIEGYSGDVRYKFTQENLEYFYEGAWYPLSGTLNYLLNGQNKVVKSILTEKEKEYLSAVVKPFKDNVKYISKNHYDGEEWIQIWTKPGLALLPHFTEGAMYKGMEVGNEYSLEELGL